MTVRARLALAAVLTAFALDAVLPGSASVAATTKPAPLAGAIEAARTKLAALDDSLDVADENYRDGQLALTKARSSQASADRALAAGRARRVLLQGRVDRIAASAYESGGQPDVSLATPDGAATYAESSALLSQFASTQDGILNAASAAQYDLAVSQTAAAQTAAATLAAARQLAATKAAILAQVAAHAALIESLVARQHTLEAIAAEKARLAVLAEQKAEAEHQAAARQAAQAAAAAAQAAAVKAAQQAAAAKAAAQLEAAQRAADRREDEAARAKALQSQQEQSQSQSTQQTTTSGDSSPPAQGAASGGSASSMAATAVSSAYRQLGAPYDWAANGPGAFDCSGLTAYVWAQAGVALPHSSQAQFEVGAHVPRSQLAPGDLVFFGAPIHHVGIYVGGGEMIDAPETGDVVRVQTISRPDYAGAVRVTG